MSVVTLLLTATPLELLWTVVALVFLLASLFSLMDAWVDNQTVVRDTTDALGDLAPSGRVIAMENIGREVCVIVGLSACLFLGVRSMMLPTAAPNPNAPQSTAATTAAALILVIEFSLAGISALGRIRRLTVSRMVATALLARAAAAAAAAAAHTPEPPDTR